ICPTYGSATPKSVKRTIIESSDGAQSPGAILDRGVKRRWPERFAARVSPILTANTIPPGAELVARFTSAPVGYGPGTARNTKSPGAILDRGVKRRWPERFAARV